MFRTLRLATLIALAMRLSPLTAEDRSRKPTEPEGQFANLIRELGADLQKDRDRAERELLNHEEAIPELRRSLNSGDPEIARRAAQIVAKLLVKKFERQIKEEGIDLFAERFLYVKDSLEREAGWQAIVNLSRSLLDFEQRNYGKIDRTKFDIDPSFKHWLEHVVTLKETSKPDELVDAKLSDVGTGTITHLIRAGRVNISDASAMGMFVTSGTIKGGGPLAAIAIAGDSANLHWPSRAIVICDGDVACHAIGYSIIFARGKVTVDYPSGFSLIVCTGPFKSRRATPNPPTTVKDNTPNLLGLVKFFETSQVGIEVTGADGGVKVTKASDGKPFARAGIKPNDVILSMGGSAAGSPDAFRRLLRKKVALHQPAVLKVRRDGKDIEITVPFAE